MPLIRITPKHPDFPPLLREIHDPPQELFVRGRLMPGPCVGVVGTRRMSSYGRQVVGLVVPELVRLGFTVVSGLALGIDGAAHQETLDAGGRTVAVLGSGIDDDSIYPRAHLTMAHRIIGAGGAVISENPPGTDCLPFRFPKRNRIVAGMCQALLLIEAPEKSGAMITARLANESGRDVWTVPGDIFTENARGPNRLIREGATPITCVDDICAALGKQPELPLPKGLEPDELRVAEALKDGPQSSDKLAKIVGLSASSAGVLLTRLELKGVIVSVGGSRYGLLH